MGLAFCRKRPRSIPAGSGLTASPAARTDPGVDSDLARNARPSLGCSSQAPPTLPSLEFPTVSAPPAAAGSDANTARSSSRRSSIAAPARRRHLARATPGRPRPAPSLARCTRSTPASPAEPARPPPPQRAPVPAISPAVRPHASSRPSRHGDGAPRGGDGSGGAFPGDSHLLPAGGAAGALCAGGCGDPRKLWGVTCTSHFGIFRTYENYRLSEK